jgi:hypothetical protein
MGRELDAASHHRVQRSTWFGREGGFLRHGEIYRDGEGEQTPAERGPTCPGTPAPQHSLIAVSFRQLFLDGLLPSRARLRFTDSVTIYLLQ